MLEKGNRKGFIFSIVCAAAAGVIVALLLSLFSTKSNSLEATVVMPNIKVFVRGEINNPGLYEIGADVRLCELIELAGGATECADIDRINPAAILLDGTTVDIPKIGSNENIDPMIVATNQKIYKAGETATTLSKGSDKITSGTININSANVSELMRLPGVGEATANKIISYREKNGNFLAIEEIMNVSGIGEKKFESMKPFLAVQ